MGRAMTIKETNSNIDSKEEKEDITEDMFIIKEEDFYPPTLVGFIIYINKDQSEKSYGLYEGNI